MKVVLIFLLDVSMPLCLTYFLHVVEALDHPTGSEEVLETAHWGKDWAGESVVLMMMMGIMMMLMMLARARLGWGRDNLNLLSQRLGSS